MREIPERAKEASAFWQATAEATPFLFVHGGEDFGVPVEQSAKLHAKLLAHGAPPPLRFLAHPRFGAPRRLGR